MKYLTQLSSRLGKMGGLSQVSRRCHAQPAETPPPSSDAQAQLAEKLKLANDCISKTLNVYEPHELMLCFNGGKDCTVLLDVLAKRWKEPPLRACSVKTFDAFEEVEEFIDSCTQRYQLQLKRCEGALRLAMEQLLAEQPQVRAMFLGCRRSDPGCAQLAELTLCDNGWPQLMRVFPLLEWSYHDVWAYLRLHKVPYCPLYDQGYTSLGERSTTRINPGLLVFDERQQKLVYRPAYALEDAKKERASREDGQGRQQQT